MTSLTSDGFSAVVRSICEAVDSPRALSVWLCFQYNQEALVNLPLPDMALSDSNKVALDYFVTSFLSKYKGLKVADNPSAVALRGWRASEDRCRETNVRFRTYSSQAFTLGVEPFLFGAARKIAQVLGRVSLASLFDECKWGPGATYDLRRSDAALDKKISSTISVTASALPYTRAVVESDPHWAACFLGVIPEGPFSLLNCCFKVVRGSRFLTVAKNAKTDRCIAAEPTGNSFLQQGVRQYIRRRLRRYGVDLDDQSINQSLARDAYRDKLATLDLSAASDTISRELVFNLLPLDWALLLDSLRSPETYVDGAWVRTEKFASMGNAFCFELETLIFWAVASSVEESIGTGSPVSVYGDDIIVGRDVCETVMKTLVVCGFAINRDKSFVDGNFFESCGKHYHRGTEITPVYQKEQLHHPSEVIRMHNRLYRYADRSGLNLKACLRMLRNAYELRPVPFIPFGVSEDGGFLRPATSFKVDPNRGYQCHVLDYRHRLIGARADALYAYKLRRRQSYANPDNKGRDAVTTQGSWRTRVRWIPEAEVLNSAGAPQV